MVTTYVEEKLPLSFRKAETEILLDLLHKGNSVEIVGIKKIGISSYLKYLLYNPDVYGKIKKNIPEIFIIPVDMSDLVEKSAFAFWRLTFKRILDQVEISKVSQDLYEYLNHKFITSIQLDDLFYTKDGVMDAILKLCRMDLLPLIVFTGFDRLEGIIDETLVENLIGLRESSGHRLMYIFTSYKSLMSSEVLKSKTHLGMFVSSLYLKPLKYKDAFVYAKSFAEKFKVSVSENSLKHIVSLSGGNTHYIQIIILLISEKRINSEDINISSLLEDERISLHSEEIFENLPLHAQEALSKLIKGEESSNKYLYNSGLLCEGSKLKVFSPLFEEYLRNKIINKTSDTNFSLSLTKKELLLFELLKSKMNKICDRSEIINQVWYEYSGFGVSDWSIDRLIARLRKKLHLQKSNFKIKTIRTRGFMLVEEK